MLRITVHSYDLFTSLKRALPPCVITGESVPPWLPLHFALAEVKERARTSMLVFLLCGPESSLCESRITLSWSTLDCRLKSIKKKMTSWEKGLGNKAFHNLGRRITYIYIYWKEDYWKAPLEKILMILDSQHPSFQNLKAKDNVSVWSAFLTSVYWHVIARHF